MRNQVIELHVLTCTCPACTLMAALLEEVAE